MDDPFSPSFGTTNLLRLTEGALLSLDWLNHSPEPKGTELVNQLKDLQNAASELDDMAMRGRRRRGAVATAPQADLLYLHKLWRSVAAVAQECSYAIESLQSHLKDLARDRDAKNGHHQVHREVYLGHRAWYEDTFLVLKLYTETLHTLISAIELMQHKDEVDENGNLSNNSEAQTLSSELTYQIAALGPKLQAYNGQGVTDLRDALADATGVSFHVPVSLNKHFVVRRSVQSFYTGREQQMAKITAAFEQPLSQTQRRFVVYGLGGSGKTELALKYAQDNAQKFWGVFFVDASTRKSAAGSYAEIAKIGGVDHNEKAAQHWLATRSVPWLLVVDNADSEMALDDLLPSGTKGCILVTSRNPAHKSYGTSGERFLELKDMNVEEANELILKVAEEPRPWDRSVQDTANAICTALGYLPLAIVHAGKAVLHNLCSWNGYLEYYERSIKLIRRQWHSRRDRSSSRNRRRRQEDDASMNVFSTYEILYRNLELRQDEEDHKDAVQLLQVFSFFHCHDIRLDTLISAAVGPTKEAKARQKSAQSQEDEETSRRLAARQGFLSSWLTAQAYRVYKFLETPPPLPDVLKNTDNLDDEDFEANVGDRLRAAMRVLISMSLVAKQDRLEERYSIHPLVHRWIRERPQISTSEQALWCQMAATVLARSIPLPPLGGSDDELSKRLKLLPHIMHVRRWQSIIQDTLKENQRLRKSWWPVAEMQFGPLQAQEAGRFSRVYSECGLFKEASQLQWQIRNFLVSRLGEENMLTLQVTMFLSGTLWQLTQSNQATELLRRVYNTYHDGLGPDHPKTLEVMDKLGLSIWLQGRFSEALALHVKAIDGMKRVHGDLHVGTLTAINNAGRVHRRLLDFDKSAELHVHALEGLRKLHGNDTSQLALEFIEDLCLSRMMGYGHTDKLILQDCHDKMEYVLDHRKRLLGKEQPYTLLAMCHLGRIKSAMGRHDEAMRMMKLALDIAERNLDEAHIGLLAGKTYYAQSLAHAGRLNEAETILRSVAEKKKYQETTGEDGEHPDRILTLWYLVRCLEKQKKYEEALEICHALEQILLVIGGHNLGSKHKFAGILRDGKARLTEKMHGSTKVWDVDNMLLWEI